MHSKENIRSALGDDDGTRSSPRLKEPGIPKRPSTVKPNSSHDRPGPSIQGGAPGERHGDPDRDCASDRGAEVDHENLRESNFSAEPVPTNEIYNARETESPRADNGRGEKQPTVTTNVPVDQVEHVDEARQDQLPHLNQNTEELKRELERWKKINEQADIERKIQEEKDRYYANTRKQPSSSRTTHGLTSRKIQNTPVCPPTDQALRTAQTQNPYFSLIVSRPSQNYIRPPVEQRGSSVRENFVLQDRSPIYNTHFQPEENRYGFATDVHGDTPRTTTSQYFSPLSNELKAQIGLLKRNTNQMKIKLQHFERTLYDHGIQTDREHYKLLSLLVTWEAREVYFKQDREDNWNYRTLKAFLMSGQDQTSSVLAWREEKDSVSSRELSDDMNHFISELRNEEVLKKFVTIHLAPSCLKSKIREKLHLNGGEFQTAVKMICDADNQERRMRARNVNYNYATNSNPNRPVHAHSSNNLGPTTITIKFAAGTVTSVERHTDVWNRGDVVRAISQFHVQKTSTQTARSEREGGWVYIISQQRCPVCE